MESDIKADNKRIIVAFGDICDFAIWSKRSSTSTEDFKNFISYTHQRFVQERGNGYYIKLLADGIMIIKEVGRHGASAEIERFLNNCHALNQDMIGQIKSLQFPRPSGFRMRVVIGDVWKLSLKKEVDYIGYTINLAFRLLAVRKDIPLIVHESVRDIKKHGQKTCPFKLEKLEQIEVGLPGVDFEDLSELWIVTKK